MVTSQACRGAGHVPDRISFTDIVDQLEVLYAVSAFALGVREPAVGVAGQTSLAELAVLVSRPAPLAFVLHLQFAVDDVEASGADSVGQDRAEAARYAVAIGVDVDAVLGVIDAEVCVGAVGAVVSELAAVTEGAPAGVTVDNV